MLLRSPHQAQGLRALVTLAQHRSHTLHTDPTTLATSTDALYDASVTFLTDLLHLCLAADIDPGEVMDRASDRFDQHANGDSCRLCGNLLDDDEDHTCGPCIDRSEEDTARTSIHTE